MSDSDDDDLFAPKGKATMSGRQVKTAERFKPAKETSSEASLLANCDFLQKVSHVSSAAGAADARRAADVAMALLRGVLTPACAGADD